MEKMSGESMNLLNENIEKLKALFPEIVTDGKIDFDMLKTLLGEEVDASNEKYSFNWVGKRNCIKFAQTPSTGTLIPCKEKSVDFDNTQNIYIEGDNVEALKLLQKTYFGKIKMIYIDPPYNTGSDFVYHDDYKDSIENYKKITGQQATANPETNGRFHTDWLNMMYPRLKLAKDLLSDDGVIFISIDDNELPNQLKVCEEIFGKRNIEVFVWKKKGGAGNTERILGILTEYVICCFKHKKPGDFNYQDFKREYKFQDEKGGYNLEGIEKTNLGAYERKTMQFAIVDPKTGVEFYPSKDMRWTLGEATVKELIGQGKIYFDYKLNKVRRIKRAADYDVSENVYYNLLTEEGSLAVAKDECATLLGNREAFDTPKPVALLKKLLKIASKKDSLVLDFFSGSATTAHAVMQLNAEDGGNRKFIMVQLPELCDEKSEAYKAGYKTICDIGEERIRRAGAKIKEENPLTTLNLDTGFKVFRLDSTNIVPWNNAEKLDEMRLYDYAKTIKDDRDDLSVAYEIMLKYGVFDKPMKEAVVSGKKMYDVGEGYMIICLADGVTMTDVEAIARLNPHCVVFKESGFADDNEKINATHTLERGGVEKILCI